MHVPEAARSALWDVTPLSGRATLAELDPVGKIDLRLDPENAEAACAVRAATGIDLPVMANTVSEGKARRVFWLGPDQWLLHCPLEEAGACAKQVGGRTDIHAPCGHRGLGRDDEPPSRRSRLPGRDVSGLSDRPASLGVPGRVLRPDRVRKGPGSPPCGRRGAHLRSSCPAVLCRLPLALSRRGGA